MKFLTFILFSLLCLSVFPQEPMKITKSAGASSQATIVHPLEIEFNKEKGSFLPDTNLVIYFSMSRDSVRTTLNFD